MRLWLLAGLVLTCAVFSILPLRNSLVKPDDNKDYSCWYNEAAMPVRTGGPLYDQPEYIYPPFAAVGLFAPLSLGGKVVMVIACVLLFSLAWYWCLQLSAWMVTGRLFDAPPIYYIVPMVLSAPYVWDMYFLGQFNLVLLALVLTAYWAVRRGQAGFRHRPSGKPLLRSVWAWSALAGALVGYAAAVKAFPVMVLGYFLWRWRWRAILLTMLFLEIFTIVVPATVRGFERSCGELAHWTQAMVLHDTEQGIADRDGKGFDYSNQSLLATVHRLVRDVPAGIMRRPERAGDPLPALPTTAPDPAILRRAAGLEPTTMPGSVPAWAIDLVRQYQFVKVNLANLSAAAANRAFVILAGLLCLVLVGCMRYGRERTAASDGVEFAMVLCLVPLLSPLAWWYFFCWLLPAFTAALAMILSRPPGTSQRRWAIGLFMASLFLQGLALLRGVNPYALTPWLPTWLGSVAQFVFGPRALAAGTLTWGAVLLFLMLAWALRRLSARAEQSD